MKTWIKENLLVNGKLVSKKCKKEWFEKNLNQFIERYNNIIGSTSFLINPTFPQRIWHIINDQYQIVRCSNPGCNKSPKFLTFTKGYLKTCSSVCAQLNPDTQEKIKQTNKKKYGVNYGLQSEVIKNKSKSTCFKKYGINNVSQIPEVSIQKKKTCFLHYGTEWFLQRTDIIKQNLITKYGVDNVQKIPNVKQNRIKTRRGNFYDSLLISDRLKKLATPQFSKQDYIQGGLFQKYKFLCNVCHKIFEDCLEDGDIPRCTHCFRGRSWFQKEVFDFLSSIVGSMNVKEGDKTILSNGKELDFYIQTHNIAIECNGLFWHGELNGKHKFYHLNKTLECEQKNIKLIHLFEDEWIEKKEIVKRRLLHIFKMDYSKIFARTCNITLISKNQSDMFLEQYHIQGKDNSSVQVGLFFNNELLAVMTFGKNRICLGNKAYENEYELYRFCSKTNIVGGAGKLLSYFIKTWNPSKITTYADRRWSGINDTFYTKIGFVFLKTTLPSYWYFGRGKNYKRYHRFGFAKHTLIKKLNVFNPLMSEWENMKNNGWDRIWDCGNLKYEKIIKS